MERSVLATLTPEQQHAAMVHAAALTNDLSGQTLARTSAAAIWGLPGVDPWPNKIHTMSEGARRRGSNLLVHHVGTPERVTVSGLVVTSAAQTVIDLARCTSLANAVAAADHALRFGLCTAEDLAEHAARVPRGGRWRTRAQLTAMLADGLAESAGESMSRVGMFLLRLPRPRLQVEHRDHDGLIGYVDFDFDGVVGEFDGKIKYKVPPGATPEEAAEIVWREKVREDRLRVRSDVARWTWSVGRNLRALAETLGCKGVRPLPRRQWFDLKAR